MQFHSNPPLSLYIHLPWCERKCPYCDFNSHQANDIDENAYVDALVDDLQQDLPLIWGRQVVSLFIGGGTPSLFSAQAIDRLLGGLRACLNLSPAIEATMEANPGSADESRFRGYREAGINRLSIGVQSFDDASLSAIGRVHDGAQAESAFRKARAAGFDNINLDLIYALPGQSPTQARVDLDKAIQLAPDHISLYQLTIEPNTLFHSKPPPNPVDDEQAWDMHEQAQNVLAKAGYQRYEISAYAKPGRQCRHNLNYWLFGDYVGIGAGAHGKITLPAEGRVIRRTRRRQPLDYQRSRGAARISDFRILDQQDLVFEFMLNSLRLVDGFDPALFSQRCGLPYYWLSGGVKRALELELMQQTEGKLIPTPLGLRFHNDLQSLFLDCEPENRLQLEPELHF